MAGTSPITCKTGVIALEGLDGCGTTTQAKLLTDRLIAEGIPAVQTQEPSTGFVGKLIREALTTTEEKSSETLVVSTERVYFSIQCARSMCLFPRFQSRLGKNPFEHGAQKKILIHFY